MNIKAKKFFKGKTYHYSTNITTTKLERILIWILGLSILIGIFLIFLFVDSFLVLFLSIFGLIILFILSCLFIIFNKKHRDERIENTNVNKK